MTVDNAQFEVVWPLGKRADAEAPAGRLDDLNGKVVAELWDWLYRGDVGFPILREELKRRFPDVQIVPYTEFGNIHGGDEREVVKRLPRELRERGCDAVIAGVGH